MRHIIHIIGLMVLIVSANAGEQKSFKITLAGWVNNPEHVQVTPNTKLSEVIAKAGGLNSFGAKYRFFRVRIVNLSITEQEGRPDSPPNQQNIKKIEIGKRDNPTIAELGLISGDILVFDKKHVFGK